MTDQDSDPRNWAKTMRDKLRKETKQNEAAEAYRTHQHILSRKARERHDQQQRAKDYVEMPPAATKSEPKLKRWVRCYDVDFLELVNNAWQKATHIYRQGRRKFYDEWSMGPAKVTTTVVGRTCNIDLEPDEQFSFEYATYGKPVIVMGPFNVQGLGGIYVGNNLTIVTDVRYYKGKITIEPRINGRRRDIPAGYPVTPYEGSTSLIAAPRQVQGLTELGTYPHTFKMLGRVQSPFILKNSWDPSTSLCGRFSNCTMGRTHVSNAAYTDGADSFNAGRDIADDLPFTVSENAGKDKTAFFPTEDWPRAGGIQMVEDRTYGTRRFGISVDATDNLVIFPLDEINSEEGWGTQTVDEQYIRRVSLTMPGWVDRTLGGTAKSNWTGAEDLNKLVFQVPQYAWNFNHLGTKMCAVATQSIEYLFDSTYWGTNARSTSPMTQTKFDWLKNLLGGQSRTPWGGGGTYGTSRYMVGFGLIEATIDIKLTGRDPEDYTVSVSVASLRTPTVTQDVTMMAGYVWHDVTCNGKSVRKGDLLTVDIQYYSRKHPQDHNKKQYTNCISVYNMTKGEETFNLCTNTQDNYNAPSQLLQVDFPTCSFLFSLRWLDLTENFVHFSYDAGLAQRGRRGVMHHTILPIILGKVQPLMYPQTMTPAVRLFMEGMVNLNGREFIDTDHSLTEPWTRLKYNMEIDYDASPRDTRIDDIRRWWANRTNYWSMGWIFYTDPDLNYLADVFEASVRYKTESAYIYPDTNASWYTDLYQYLHYEVGQEYEYMLLCTTPKYGWHYFQYIIMDIMQVREISTFFVHPNGSWGMFDDTQFYDRNGLPFQMSNATVSQPFVQPASAPFYADYTTDRIEHVIYDRVHFEFKNSKRTLAGKDTSFTELYNRAVAKIEDEGQRNPDLAFRGPGALERITNADQVVKFTKENAPVATGVCLALKGVRGDSALIGWLVEGWIGTGESDNAGANWGAISSQRLINNWRVAPGEYDNLLGFGLSSLAECTDPNKWANRFFDPVIIMRPLGSVDTSTTPNTNL
jgi:hypothetical protein